MKLWTVTWTESSENDAMVEAETAEAAEDLALRMYADLRETVDIEVTSVEETA